MHDELTRREALRRAGAGIGAATVMSNSLIAKALAAAPRCGTLGEIEHVVILIQENRSFDHYFGSYRGVRGFADPNVGPLGDGSGLSIFAQPGYPGGFDGGHLYPFHLDSDANGECTNDIDHSWGPQHSYWNGGELDGFVSGHLAVDGASNGPLTMGYYTRNDLSLYYALADAFTICDRYFCSVIGPTDPNRLYSFSATLDPAAPAAGRSPPPTPPAGTQGESLTVTPLPSDAAGVPGPIGLGFRVPMLVVSPFSRGGFVCGDTFDHTSLLRFIETRFGVEVPNLTAWRRSVTGDLTSAFNFVSPDDSVPSLPHPSLVDSRITMSSCATSAPLDLATDATTTVKTLEDTLVAPYPVTVNSAPPPQEPGRAPKPSGPVACG